MRTGAITRSKHAGEIPQNKQKAPLTGTLWVSCYTSQTCSAHMHTCTHYHACFISCAKINPIKGRDNKHGDNLRGEAK